MTASETVIMLVCHKPASIPDDPSYLPIQVGFGPDIPGCIRDSVGDSISDKNGSYCELTAQWWLWRNSNAQIKGLMHYRRVLSDGPELKAVPFEPLEVRRSKSIKGTTAESLLERYDIILPKAHDYALETARDHYERSHVSGHAFDIMRDHISQFHPKYLDAYDRSLGSRRSHLFNMFISSGALFDEYSEWLFDILGSAEEALDITGYSISEKRVFGYLSELLLDAWIDANGLRFVELPVLFLERQNLPKRFALGALKKLGLYDPVRSERSLG